VDEFKPVGRFTVPWGAQQIELQEVAFAAGGARLLRVRIREGRRFTIFEIDAATARAWGDAMSGWAARQPGAEAPVASTGAAPGAEA
jgi:hypothetical protein